MLSAFSYYMGIQEQISASTIKEHKLKDMLSICINHFHFFIKIILKIVKGRCQTRQNTYMHNINQIS